MIPSMLMPLFFILSRPEKLKTSESISNQYFSKIVEDLISRARKLENDILR